jgi:5-methylcytosine-specific restriction protein A
MAKDKDYIMLIHTMQWLQLRRDAITRHPLCEQCKANGYITPSVEVHHIIPVESAVTYREKVRLMYDPTNLRALCHDCHVKIHTGMGRSGREATRKRNDERVKKIIKKFFG